MVVRVRSAGQFEFGVRPAFLIPDGTVDEGLDVDPGEDERDDSGDQT